MAEGGNIVIINGTGSNWIRTKEHSYQMVEWSFPQSISPGERVGRYMAFSKGISEFINDDAGDVTYELEGTGGLSFSIQARCVDTEFLVQIYFRNINTSSHAKGSVYNIGWQHDGTVYFVLSSDGGNYICNGDSSASDWMSNSLKKLGSKKIKEICIPGTHDSGMSYYDSGTAFAHACNTVTQDTGILGQLKYGARYFDIRPVIHAAHFYTGHYSDVSVGGWQGANGQSIESIINDVNEFTSSHNELIILNFSHSLDTDNGYSGFSQSNWNNLMGKLSSINHLFHSDNNKEDLTLRTLNSFIKHGPAVLLVFEGGGVKLGDREGHGFFYHSEFSPYNSYSNTEDVEDMINDQTSKMEKESPEKYFLYSWTLTQTSFDAVTCTYSIRELADRANYKLCTAYDKTTRKHYPNILYIDNMKNTYAAAISIAINNYLHG